MAISILEQTTIRQIEEFILIMNSINDVERQMSELTDNIGLSMNKLKNDLMLKSNDLNKLEGVLNTEVLSLDSRVDFSEKHIITLTKILVDLYSKFEKTKKITDKHLNIEEFIRVNRDGTLIFDYLEDINPNYTASAINCFVSNKSSSEHQPTVWNDTIKWSWNTEYGDGTTTKSDNFFSLTQAITATNNARSFNDGTLFFNDYISFSDVKCFNIDFDSSNTTNSLIDTNCTSSSNAYLNGSLVLPPKNIKLNSGIDDNDNKLSTVKPRNLTDAINIESIVRHLNDGDMDFVDEITNESIPLKWTIVNGGSSTTNTATYTTSSKLDLSSAINVEALKRKKYQGNNKYSNFIYGCDYTTNNNTTISTTDAGSIGSSATVKWNLSLKTTPLGNDVNLTQAINSEAETRALLQGDISSDFNCDFFTKYGVWDTTTGILTDGSGVATPTTLSGATKKIADYLRSASLRQSSLQSDYNSASLDYFKTGNIIVDGDEIRYVSSPVSLNSENPSSVERIKFGGNFVELMGSVKVTTDKVEADVFEGTATKAKYADIAEKYSYDPSCKPLQGDLVSFSFNDSDYELCEYHPDKPYAGVVSTDPAYMLNSGKPDETHIYIALQGRVPLNVRCCNDRIYKGEYVVTTNDNEIIGVRKTEKNRYIDVIGIALSNSKDGIVEVKLI